MEIQRNYMNVFTESLLGQDFKAVKQIKNDEVHKIYMYGYVIEVPFPDGNLLRCFGNNKMQLIESTKMILHNHNITDSMLSVLSNYFTGESVSISLAPLMILDGETNG